jgi:hypothetical protein
MSGGFDLEKMKLRSRLENRVAVPGHGPRRTGFAELIFGQNLRACLEWEKLIMPLWFSCQTAFCSVKHYKNSRIPTDRQILQARHRFIS